MESGFQSMLIGMIACLFAIPHFGYVVNNQIPLPDCDKTLATCTVSISIISTGNHMWILDSALILLPFIGFAVGINQWMENRRNKNKYPGLIEVEVYA